MSEVPVFGIWNGKSWMVDGSGQLYQSNAEGAMHALLKYWASYSDTSDYSVKRFREDGSPLSIDKIDTRSPLN